MQYLGWAVLAYVAVSIQIALAPFVRIGDVQPNLVLTGLMLLALQGPRDSILLGSLLFGFAQDIATGDALGLYTFAYGCIGLGAVSIKHLLYAQHPGTHFVLSLFAGLIVSAVVVLAGTIRGTDPAIPPLLGETLYTAVVAAPLLWGAARLRDAAGSESGRSRLRVRT